MQAPCELIASNTFDYLETTSGSTLPPASRSLTISDTLHNSQSYQIRIFPLVCFLGTHTIKFEKPIVKNINLPFDQAMHGWTTALLAFEDNVDAIISQGTIAANHAGTPLVAVEDAFLKLQDHGVIQDCTGIVGGAVAAWDKATVLVHDYTLRSNTARKVRYFSLDASTAAPKALPADNFDTLGWCTTTTIARLLGRVDVR